MECQWITSNKGKKKLIHEGYLYVKQKNLKQGITSYECERRRHSQCNAKVKEKDDMIIATLNEHTHGPDVGSAKSQQLKQTMKRRAEDTQETPQQILTQTVEQVSEVTASQMPATRSIRRAIRRWRQHHGNPLPVPPSRADMLIPEEYTCTTNGEPFLLFDSGHGDNERVLIFSTQSNLQLLRENGHWFMDGTFKVVPEVFFQLYTIHVLMADNVLPCVYALLPNKQCSTYRQLFQKMLHLEPALSPQSVMVDYERGAINAFSEVFPDAHVQGCFRPISQ